MTDTPLSRTHFECFVYLIPRFVLAQKSNCECFEYVRLCKLTRCVAVSVVMKGECVVLYAVQVQIIHNGLMITLTNCTIDREKVKIH